MATRSNPFEDDEAEAEPVLVEMDDTSVTLTLDDGEELTFVLVELRDALDAEARERKARAA
jgi:nitrogen fixation-related uncharacterized protein